MEYELLLGVVKEGKLRKLLKLYPLVGSGSTGLGWLLVRVSV